MGIKDFFKAGESLSIIASSRSLDEVGREAGESAEYVKTHVVQKDRFFPHVDFSTASNFARYGLAEQYYEDSIKRVYLTYPYDGSPKEKVEWHNESTYVDEYIFDKEYPRTTGYVILSADGWGTLSGSIVGGYGAPSSSLAPGHEYIQIKGGPNPDTRGVSLPRTFPGIHEGKANVYDASTKRKSNLALDSTSGFSVEFWFKKDAFSTTKTEKEVIFDLWNGAASSSAGYGRLTIELTGASSGTPFLVTVQSGTNGYFQQSIGSAPTTGSLTSWKHYAFTFVSSSGDVETKLYINGALDQTLNTGSSIDNVTGSLIANIGALRTAPSGNSFYNTAVGSGFGKLSGSLDEFRYWTKKRAPKEVGRHWWTQIGGGTNTDVGFSGTLTNKFNENSPVDLGVYYKFNEGVTLTASTDSTVLDYSGRVSNGIWSGYTSNSRNTGSAIVSASATTKEFEDPIVYSSHPSVVHLLSRLKASGSTHDLENNTSLYYSLPSWIIEEDEDGAGNTTKKLMQVISSYFDTLHLQIENLTSIKNANYVSASMKPYPFTDRLLNNFGFVTSDILSDATDLEKLANRNEVRKFEQKIYDVKNNIYKNIYNNLVYIYKTKGTEKSFRNLIRGFGVDDELIKLNLYADSHVEHEIRDNYRNTAYRKKFVTFDSLDRYGATIYQSASSDSNSTLSYISGSDTALLSTTAEFWLPWTMEAEVIFPTKVAPGLDGHYSTTFTSASLFGAHEAVDDSSDFTWASGDNNNFQVYSVREEAESKNVKFVLTSSLGGWPTLSSSFYEDVYDNEKWNFAVRYYLDKTNNGGLVKGGKVNDIVGQSGNNVTAYVEFYGVNSVLDQVVDEFHVSGALTIAGGADDPSNTSNKRIYCGAHRTNFTGAVLQKSDAKISSIRYWNHYLTNGVIKAHARDASNFGSERPYENVGLLKTSLSGVFVPSMETLSLHWDFNTVTGSDASGDFIVEDYSSGSADTTSRYSWFGNIVKNQHVGRGRFFPASSTDVISNEFVYSAKQRLPDAVNSDDMVNIISQEDEIFTRESRPIKYFFALEKSMYQTVSEEMINFFATVVDFNNLIGEPVNRYRQDYKDLGKIRQLFFEKVRNTPSLEKYINFYKWIDSAISDMIMQLVPASANMSEKLRNVVESHVLERNKYWTKFPTLEFKASDPIVGIRSTAELLYPWKYGHAPISNSEADNCFWWSERAKASNAVITSGDSGIDTQRDEFNDVDKHRSGSVPNLSSVGGTSYAGSAYAVNRFSKPYRFGGALSENEYLHGGVNFHRAKKLGYINIATEIFGGLIETSEPTGTVGIPGLTASVNYMLVSGSDVAGGINVCNDVINPTEKKKYAFDVRNSREFNDAGGYSHGKGEYLLPFNIHSSSVTTGYASEIANSTFGLNLETPIDFTNVHVDAYAPHNEVPMQSPFTEKFVGGRQHRHVDINKYDSSLSTKNKLQDQSTRPEAWYIILGDGGDTFAMVGPTYTTTGEYDKDVLRATRMRSEFAKRPVNIRNIQQTTGSGIGNYETNWNLVSTVGRTQNNAYFKDNGGVSLPPRYVNALPKTTNVHTLISITADGDDCEGDCGNYFGVFIDDEGASTGGRFVEQNEDEANIFTLPRRDLTGSNSIIVSRFSAPGGPEVMSRGYLDINAEEYSVHNALPFRNLSVRSSGSGEQGTIRMSISGSTTVTSAKDREGLRTRLTRHCGQFGTDSQWGDTVASFHKVNRNPLKRIKEA